MIEYISITWHKETMRPFTRKLKLLSDPKTIKRIQKDGLLACVYCKNHTWETDKVNWYNTDNMLCKKKHTICRQGEEAKIRTSTSYGLHYRPDVDVCLDFNPYAHSIDDG